ncbi:hypothetical protein [Streptomyces sp. SID5910]|uniref:hypothetical protein n=1 Tax=Streptomyces sp. SID5910 TaxID=2690312 RepID=UPI0013ABB28B|nr:hypothetical protein [Streptomyces sp. SID5910]MYR43091.1 hypothetical protein [Streptomyces sp. SID5910]
MKYTDHDGDTWEAVNEGRHLLCVASSVSGFEGSSFTREFVEEHYGPLNPEGAQEQQDAPAPALPTVEGVMSRASVFQSAHALVTGLPWGDEEKPSVYDVLSVAKWLEGDE